jgi:hypothetical protein
MDPKVEDLQCNTLRNDKSLPFDLKNQNGQTQFAERSEMTKSFEPNIINQLGLNANLSGNDNILLEKVFNNLKDGKQTKMSPQERNYLMSKLGNQNSNQYVSTKDFKDMTPEEKVEHRDILKKKLREKQKGLQQVRTGGKKMQETAKTSLQDMLSKIDMSKLNLHAEQVAQASVTNSSTNTTNVDSNTEQVIEESLDDFIDA